MACGTFPNLESLQSEVKFLMADKRNLEKVCMELREEHEKYKKVAIAASEHALESADQSAEIQRKHCETVKEFYQENKKLKEYIENLKVIMRVSR